ncbi:methyltransferase domain-containing protein [Belliella sp. DSM 107340]|uniref:Methyltransferase domain-containing protein n=1 Tax=Belliella calami TaxID=2923436 RepID=A0ABS9UMR6_9BACT|nr:methyltransferase domain-containing protein [Belliella calami]MCH7397725.1 methyltransferase domain-containing protein [Belliella calami]
MIIHKYCPICSSTNIVGDAIDLHRFGPHISRARCKSCGLIFANPMADADDLNKYYNDYYEKDIYQSTDYKNIIKDEILKIENLTESEIKKAAPYFSIYKETGKFLDVGCGLGMGLAYANRLGFELFATEFDQGAIDFVKSQFPVNVHKGDLDTANFPDNYFDFIHMSHVIEHVLDPVAYFTEMKRILKPEGTLAIGTPDMSSLLYKSYKWLNHLQLKVPRIIDGLEHTYIFPKGLLADLIKQQGLTIKLHYSHTLGEKYRNLVKYKMPIKKKVSRVVQNFFKINQWIVCVK